MSVYYLLFMILFITKIIYCDDFKKICFIWHENHHCAFSVNFILLPRRKNWYHHRIWFFFGRWWSKRCHEFSNLGSSYVQQIRSIFLLQIYLFYFKKKRIKSQNVWLYDTAQKTIISQTGGILQNKASRYIYCICLSTTRKDHQYYA